MNISSKNFDGLEYVGEGTEGVVRKQGKYVLKKVHNFSNYKRLLAYDSYEARVANIKRLNYFFTHLVLLKDIDEVTFINFISQNHKLTELYFSLTDIETRNYFSKFLESFLNQYRIKFNHEYKAKVLK